MIPLFLACPYPLKFILGSFTSTYAVYFDQQTGVPRAILEELLKLVDPLLYRINLLFFAFFNIYDRKRRKKLF